MHFVNTERINKVVIYFKSSSICVSPGFGGLSDSSPAVRPAALRRSDRRFNIGQTGGIHSVRPADQSRSDRDPSISRVTFISAKSFQFLGISTIHPPLVGLILVIRSYKLHCRDNLTYIYIERPMRCNE